MRIVFVLAVCATAIFSLIGCIGKKTGDPAGPVETDFIGTWKHSEPEFTTEFSYSINADSTFLWQRVVDGVVDSRSTGIWTATTESITLTYAQCQEDTIGTGVFSDVPCDDPATPDENEAVETIPLTTMHGNSWDIPIDATSSWTYTRQ